MVLCGDCEKHFDVSEIKKDGDILICCYCESSHIIPEESDCVDGELPQVFIDDIHNTIKRNTE